MEKDSKDICYVPQKFLYVGDGNDQKHRDKTTEGMKEHLKKSPRGVRTYHDPHTYPFELVGGHPAEVVEGVDDGYKSITNRRRSRSVLTTSEMLLNS
jgi:hypothetical protein